MAAVYSGIAPETVLAAGTSCGPFTLSFYGTTRSASAEGVKYLAGVQSEVTDRVSDVCTSITDNTNTSSQWVMLAGTGSSDGFVQDGVARHAGGCDCKQFFYEAEQTYNSHDGPFYIPWSGSLSLPWGQPVNGTQYTYKTTWKDSGDNYVHFIFCDPSSCTDYDYVTWNPSSAGWAGADAELLEETHYTATDMSGKDVTRAAFLNNMLRKHVSGGGSGWYAVTSLQRCIASGQGICGVGSYWRYHMDMLSSNTEFDVYTCPLDPSKTC